MLGSGSAVPLRPTGEDAGIQVLPSPHLPVTLICMELAGRSGHGPSPAKLGAPIQWPRHLGSTTAIFFGGEGSLPSFVSHLTLIKTGHPSPC